MGLFNKKTPSDEPPVDDSKKDEPDLYEERFSKIEKSVEEIGSGFSQLVALLQQEQQVREPEPEAKKDGPPYSPFLDELAVKGSEAILADPSVNAVLDIRMNALLDWEASKRELAQQYPEAYDPTSEVFKTKAARRNWFEKVGVHPSVLNTRSLEELMVREAAGAHVDKVAEGRRSANKPGFVEGGGGGPGASGGTDLTEQELSVSEVFGLKGDDYKKYKNQLIEGEVIGGARR